VQISNNQTVKRASRLLTLSKKCVRQNVTLPRNRLNARSLAELRFGETLSINAISIIWDKNFTALGQLLSKTQSVKFLTMPQLL
jgi:hypothetical protein